MQTPRDWTALGKRLEQWLPPDDPFNPAGEWVLHYARHALIPERNGTPGGNQVGSLHIQQKHKGDTLHLQVSEVEKDRLTTLTTKAGISCSKDVLMTPQRWSLSCNWQTPLEVVKTSEFDQQHKGRIENKEIIFVGKNQHSIPAPERWTSNWNLFAAIQKMPFTPDKTYSFDLLESLDLLKPGQRIIYSGIHAVRLGSQTIDLHVFEQTGRGVMPWHWWLDNQHRVILAAGNRRAYLLMKSVQGGAL